MFDYIKATYKVGDWILVQCSMGDIKGEIIYLGEDSIGIKSADGKRRIVKGTDISYCEDCEGMLGTEQPANVIAGHEYVDLGLPSGTLWATCNVGATMPTEYGDYFAWGETRPKSDYSWDTYKWCDGNNELQTKYSVDFYYGSKDGLTTLLAEDDAATANWGTDWRMPTKEELQELLEGCNWKWTENFNGSGVAGYIGTSETNGNTIFLPAAGYRGGSGLFVAVDDGHYWSSSLDESSSDCALKLGFFSEVIDWNNYYRFHGESVRAVVK